ncbi:MAG: SLBB domain-containing protein [Desulfuromonadales bacterium]|nr:SLBB domain-containing protein [Desulfuromonadales bacterium]
MPVGTPDGLFDAGEGSDSPFHKTSVGEIDLKLKRFGHDFFSRPGSFQPDPAALVGPDYTVGPGDTFKIDIWGNIEGNYLVTVDRNGEIAIPRVGVVNLSGQTFAEARETIRRQVGKYFSNFEINVTMGGLRSIQIYLVGEVKAPGSYTLSSLSTVLTALSSAGGPTIGGSLRNVQLLRQGAPAAVIDFYDFFLAGDKSRDMRLQAGDTIFVPIAGPKVGVAGNVRRPALYELKGGEALAQVLELAGGVVPTAYLQKVQVQRVEAHQQRVVVDLDLQSGQAGAPDLQMPLQDGDLVKIYPISGAGGFVTLAGYVAYPGQYQWSKGQRLADLIGPYSNLLPEFFPGMARIVRIRPPEYRPEALTVNLEKALRGDPEHNLLLAEYDEIRLFSRKEMEETPEVTVSGAVLSPGTYRLYEEMTLRDLVAAAGNLRRRAYTAEAEVTRYLPAGRETRTERRIIDLSQAMLGDPAHDLPLLPDDHVFIRSIPDYGERLMVKIEGEVLFPGTYAISKGEALSSILERAGGFTRDAYLRGGVFSRESLKESQQARLNQLILEQEQEVQRTAMEIARGALSPEELTSAQTILEARTELLTKLKQTPANGRMVMSLAALPEFRGSAYDIELMNGDTLNVPKNPQSVTVLGQVYNPVSIAYQPGRTVGHYLDKVGGPKKDADTGEMFIVRADGTVVSAQQGGWGVRWDGDSHRWQSGGFRSTVLHPGDTVLVPEKIRRTAWLRELRDISAIVFQLALGAAAVASF